MADKKLEQNPGTVTLDLSEAAYRRIEGLVQETGVQSRSDVVSNALRLYEMLHQQKQGGWTIHMVRGDEAKELLLTEE